MKLFLNVKNDVLKDTLEEIFEAAEGYELIPHAAQADIVLCDSENPSNVAITIPQEKPFTLESLLRHIEKQQMQDAISIDRFSYNPRLRILEDQESHTSQALTEKEAALLLYFWKRKGHEVGRESLVKDIWGYHEDVDSHTLETHIYRLRQKIEEDPKSPELLITTPGGYLLNA